MKKMAVKRTMYALMSAAVTASTFGGAMVAAMPTVLADDGASTLAWTPGSNFTITNGEYVHGGTGHASITLTGNPDQPLEKKTFTLYKIFDAENADHNESINYTFNPTYEQAVKNVVAEKMSIAASEVTEYVAIDYIQSLNTYPVEGADADQELESRYSDFRFFIEDLRNEITRLSLKGQNYTVDSASDENSISIKGLDYGYYLLDETTESGPEGSSDDYFASSLCIVDTANPHAEVHIKSDYPSIIKKIQEDDNRDAVGNNGWNDIGDYEIGQTVPYQYTSTIPDMNGFQSYYYAFHDQMDEELTFNGKDSVTITINGGTKAQGQSYTLTPEQFNVYTASEGASNLDKGDTFMIEITDIKDIIDKNFTGIKTDKEGEADYSGFTVTTNYTATLNDLAAADTGRPGYENDVRLEFSNDFDGNGWGETGYTPWDTVVCFTFAIEGLKTNDHEMSLEGAEFQLFSDEDCTERVYVKAGSNSLVEPMSDIDHATSPDGDEENPDGDPVTTGANPYIVINRDSTGGTDHTGGTEPAGSVNMVSDENGNFTIYGLDSGVYYLKEVKAPAGYRQLLDPIRIEVTATYDSNRNNYVAGDGATEKTLVALSATAHIDAFYDGQWTNEDTSLTTDVSDGSATIQIVNEVGSKLPVTGSNQMVILLGAGVALMGGALVVSRRKKALQ